MLGTADRHPNLVLEQIAGFATQVDALAANLLSGVPSPAELYSRVKTLLRAALAEASSTITEDTTKRYGGKVEAVVPAGKSIVVDYDATRAFLTGRIYQALVSIMGALDDDNTTDFFGVDKQLILNFLADIDATKLAEIDNTLSEFAVAKNAGDGSIRAFDNTLSVLTDDPRVVAWFTRTLSHATNCVLADLGADQLMLALRCLLLPVFLALARHWRAIRQLDDDFTLDFSSAGTRHDPKFMVGNPKTIGTLPANCDSAYLVTLFLVTPSVCVNLGGEIVARLSTRGSNICIPVQLYASALAAEMDPIPILKGDHVHDNMNATQSLFDDQLGVVAPVLDIFHDLNAPTELAGDRAIWDKRMELADGTMSDLQLCNKPIGQAGFDTLQRIFTDRPRRLVKLTLISCSLGPTEAIRLAQILPSSLTKLYLANDWIGDAGAEALAARLPPSLTLLYISSNQIGDLGAKAIAANLPLALTQLALPGNCIGNMGAAAIAAKMPPTLAGLYLNKNKIGNVGAATIAAMLPPTLTELWLGNNVMSDSGFTAIRRAWAFRHGHLTL